MSDGNVTGRRAHHNLVAWQEAMDLVKEVYQATAEFPAQKDHQMTVRLTPHPSPSFGA